MQVEMTRYRTYPETVKRAVASSRNPYMFPDLNIPRTTALHWIKQSSSHFEKVDIDAIYEHKIKNLEEELRKERALRELIEKVRKIFPYHFNKKRVRLREHRRLIVHAVQKCMAVHKTSTCLTAISLTKGTYYRWSSEVTSFEKSKTNLSHKSPSSLTDIEVIRMKRFVTSKKFAHLSLSSLCLLAQRRGELFSSPETWRKYIGFYEWRRPFRKKFIKNEKKEGIRAEKPNEIWHIDVTRIFLLNGIPLYLQVILDNYSRYVICWHLTRSISARNTKRLIQIARRRAVKERYPDTTQVMMDAGSENTAAQVQTYLTTSKSMRRLLAKVDISSSNSMVEAFFRSLKNNYLYFQKTGGFAVLKKKIKFFINQHNHVIPHSAFKGAAPYEMFIESWGAEDEENLRKLRQKAVQNRRERYKRLKGFAN